jgi:hypothetical protein
VRCTDLEQRDIITAVSYEVMLLLFPLNASYTYHAALRITQQDVIKESKSLSIPEGIQHAHSNVKIFLYC